MQIIDNELIQPENEIEVFQKLYNYMERFNRKWKETIRPASKESMELLKSISKIEKWCNDFPQLYKMFLETMGEDDGGLLSISLIGTGNIKEIIDLYQEFQEFYPNVFDMPYFTFFQNEMGMELAFDLRDAKKGNILEMDCGEKICVNSESFEKLLFQSAFNGFERFNTYIEIGGSLNQLKNGLNNNLERKEIFDIVDKIIAQYELRKVWFSDKNHYIAIGEDSGLYMEKKMGILGFVTSDNTKFAKELVDELIKNIGVHIYYPHSNI